MITASNFIPSAYTKSIESGRFIWSAPSNIALVKYWGKKDNQIPANPSVSFTLNNCKTITELAFAKKKNDGNFSFDLLFEGKPKTLEKIVSSINQNYVVLRFLDSLEQFVGINMNKYGPFKKDDVAILPFENARSIIENNKAIEINMIG